MTLSFFEAPPCNFTVGIPGLHGFRPLPWGRWPVPLDIPVLTDGGGVSPMTLAKCKAEKPCRFELDVAADKVAQYEERHLTSSPLHADEATTVAEVADDVIYKHPNEFETVVGVIEAVAAENAGRVNPNIVRPRIPGHITPQVVPSTYSRLLRQGRLRATGVKVPNTDRKGRNTNKEIDIYELVDVPADADAGRLL